MLPTGGRACRPGSCSMLSSEAQRILEEPRPHNHARLLDKLVEVLERMVAAPFPGSRE
jgi:hypothetical protein